MKDAIILTMFAVALGQGPNTADPPNSFEPPFADGGIVYLRLTSGDYTIRAGASDRVVMRWQADDPTKMNEMKKIKIRSDVVGIAVAIRTDGPTKKGPDPHRSSTTLRSAVADARR